MTRVLLVEDSDHDAEVATRSLTSTHWLQPEIVRVGSLHEALDVIDDGFDVVITDLGLPDSRGLATAASLLARTPVPVIALTVRDDVDTASRALEMGCADYVPKQGPGTEPLARTVHHALRRHHKLRVMDGKAGTLQGVFGAIVDGLLAREGQPVPRPEDVAAAKTGVMLLDDTGKVLAASEQAAAALAEAFPRGGPAALADWPSYGDVERQGMLMVELAAGYRGVVIAAPHGRRLVCMLVPPGRPIVAGELGDALHHFRTPLQPILADLATIATVVTEPTGALERIRRNLDRLESFGEHFVDMLALEEGTLPIPSERFDAMPIIRDAAKRHGVENLTAPARLDVRCNHRRLRVACDAILARVGPHGECRLDRRDGQARLLVTMADWTGPSPDALLTPYEAPLATVDPGGILLYSSRLALRRCGGSLHIATERGQIRFTLSVPLATGDADDTRAARPPRPQRRDGARDEHESRRGVRASTGSVSMPAP